MEGSNICATFYYVWVRKMMLLVILLKERGDLRRTLLHARPWHCLNLHASIAAIFQHSSSEYSMLIFFMSLEFMEWPYSLIASFRSGDVKTHLAIIYDLCVYFREQRLKKFLSNVSSLTRNRKLMTRVTERQWFKMFQEPHHRLDFACTFVRCPVTVPCVTVQNLLHVRETNGGTGQ